MTLSQSLAVLPAQNNPFGLVYENALKENIEGRVNIRPVTYRLHEIEIAANVYVPAGYDPANKYAAIVVAHPNGGSERTGCRALCTAAGGEWIYYFSGGCLLSGSERR
ncbi:MAG: hypothetical protein LUH63_22110 [Parabacteroides sp.]|nr:hypothetical protein [Parabacteroides sp.]